MVTDSNYNYCGEHCIMQRIIESLCCTPETNITLYANYTSMIILFLKKIPKNDAEIQGKQICDEQK